MWIFEKKYGWKNITKEQFLAMSQKLNGIEPENGFVIVPEKKEVLSDTKKPKARKPRTKKTMKT